MICTVYFEGDSKELQNIQHDCYFQALSIIVNGVNEVTRFAIVLLGEETNSNWGRINNRSPNTSVYSRYYCF